jgi:hypothetical protein
MWLMPADRTVRAGSPVRFARYDRMHSVFGNHAAVVDKRDEFERRSRQCFT